jgi:hypothetical protein
MMDYDEMRAFQVREETGRLPDEVYFQGAEDALDPDQAEITGMVMDQYSRTNAERAAAQVREQNAALRTLLIERGMSEDEINQTLAKEML